MYMELLKNVLNNNNNKSIYKVQNRVRRVYSERAGAHKHTHTSILTIQTLIYTAFFKGFAKASAQFHVFDVQ